MVQHEQLFKSEQDIQNLEYDENVILKFMISLTLVKNKLIYVKKKQHTKGKVISGLINLQDESLHIISIKFVILRIQLTRPVLSSYS